MNVLAAKQIIKRKKIYTQNWFTETWDKPILCAVGHWPFDQHDGYAYNNKDEGVGSSVMRSSNHTAAEEDEAKGGRGGEAISTSDLLWPFPFPYSMSGSDLTTTKVLSGSLFLILLQSSFFSLSFFLFPYYK